MSLRDHIKSIDNLLSSEGWKILQHVMDEEILAAARNLASAAALPEKVVDFQRGAIWATDQLSKLPQRVKLRLENELLLQEAMSETPATAGKE